jgi:hypothetical protein
MAVQRLTAAYRSRPRPSSTPGAKASTMCPYSLDGELHPSSKARVRRYLYLLAFVQFSSSAEADERGSPVRGLSKLSSVRSAGTSTSARAPLRSGPVDVQEMPSGSPVREVRSALLPRKEVIQPQLPLRLPCYDFTPITGPTFDGCLP